MMSATTNIGTLVTTSSDVGKGRPMITGTKTSVRRVVVLYKQGASPEEIARRLSHLSLACVEITTMLSLPLQWRDS